MTKKQKLIAISLGLVSIFAGAAYIQIQKALKYALKFKEFRVKKINLSEISFDLFYDLVNKSAISFDISEIKVDVYVNGFFITKVLNKSDQKVYGNTTTTVGVNVLLEPKKLAKSLKQSAPALLLYPEKLKIKYDLEIKIKKGILRFTIPYSDTMTLKELKS